MTAARLIGDDIAEISVADSVAARLIAEKLRTLNIFEEIVPALRAVTVQFDPLAIDAAAALSHLEGASVSAAARIPAPAGTLTIPVRYGGEEGPDLGLVAASAGLSPEEFISLHTNTDYPVEMIGFTPGFAYLGGLDASVTAGRLETPRAHVPAGSIGVIRGYSGLYALLGPGGWPIVGRATIPLFEARAEEPFRIIAGMKVRFEPV